MGLPAWITDLLTPKRPLAPMAPEAKMSEINNIVPMGETLNPVQRYMNSIHDITEKAGWDVYDWTVADMEDFINACAKCSNNMPKATS